MNDSNRDQLIAAARLLRPLLTDLVFVGGAVTGLLITDPAAADPRTTFDVDAIAEIASYAEYAAFGDRLHALGFVEDTREGAPLCRWVQNETTLDVMPLDEKILGFSNRWYRDAMKLSVEKELCKGLEIRMITAPFFVATKLAAFNSRGKGDFFGSRDLEDVIAVVDGRAELTEEVRAPQRRVAEPYRYSLQASSGNSSISGCSAGLYPFRSRKPVQNNHRSGTSQNHYDDVVVA
jgi:hypothetical protein